MTNYLLLLIVVSNTNSYIQVHQDFEILSVCVCVWGTFPETLESTQTQKAEREQHTDTETQRQRERRAERERHTHRQQRDTTHTGQQQQKRAEPTVLLKFKLHLFKIPYVCDNFLCGRGTRQKRNQN